MRSEHRHSDIWKSAIALIAIFLVTLVSCSQIIKTPDLSLVITGKDNAKMVLIPAGNFQMGADGIDRYPGDENAMPSHLVYLDAFYMDVYEVTNGQYRKFMEATGYKPPQHFGQSKFDQLNQPVIMVNWHDAQAYAKWAGKRLPTEAEWEKAARGGIVGKRYPWGDTLSHKEANFKLTSGRDRWNTTAPVGSFKPNGYGIYDMAGNVFEWCSDRYDPNFYPKSPKNNPICVNDGNIGIVRGGSWWNDSKTAAYALRVTYRGTKPIAGRYSDVGFRCVLDAKL